MPTAPDNPDAHDYAGRIQLITSKDHYAFNLAWVKALPPAPKR